MKWLRLHTEIKDDPKMLELDDHQFRIWISVLAMAGEAEERGVIPASRPRGLAAALHTDPDRMEEAFTLFAEIGMMERQEDGSLLITNFIKRQYDKPSDTPEEVAKRKTKMKQEAEKQGREEADRPGNAQERAGTPEERPGNAQERAGTPEERPGNAQERAGTPEERPGNAQERAYPDTDSDSDSEDTQRREDPPNPPSAEPMLDGNGAAVFEFAQSFRDKHGGEGPHVAPKHAKALVLLRIDLGDVKYGEALTGFFADAWASENGHSVGVFVGSSMDRWRHTKPPTKNGARGSPAPPGKSALAHGAEAEEARLRAIFEGNDSQKGQSGEPQRLQ